MAGPLSGEPADDRLALSHSGFALAHKAPVTIKFADALARARQYGGQIQSANARCAAGQGGHAQVRAGRLPSVSAFNQFIYTEGNGTASGVFVANDGVHVYNEQAVVHQELLPLAFGTAK